MDHEIEKRVIELAAEEAGVEPAEVSLAHHLAEDLEFDSLGRVEFAMKVEDAFGVTVPEDVLDRVQTVGDAVKAVTAALDGSRDSKVK